MREARSNRVAFLIAAALGAVLPGASVRAGARVHPTLQRLYKKGTKLRLRHPWTGGTAEATVLREWFSEESGIPLVTVVFEKPIGKGNHRYTYARDALELVGKPKSARSARERQEQAVCVAAIQQVLGLDASHIKIKRLPGVSIPTRIEAGLLRRRIIRSPYLDAMFASEAKGLRGKRREKLRQRFFDELESGQGGPAGTYDPFHDTVLLPDEYSAYSRSTRIHELLHALSSHFVRAVGQWGLRPLGGLLLEGITEHFTERVAREALGIRLDETSPYAEWVQLARALERLLGEKELQRIFFGAEADPLKALKEAIDRRGGRLTFTRLMYALMHADLEAARHVLEGRPVVLPAVDLEELDRNILRKMS